MEVRRNEASERERHVQAEFFDKWKESFEIKKACEISMSDLPEYLDHLQYAYGHQGINKEVRKKMDAKLYDTKWTNPQFFKFSYDNREQSGAGYGVIGFKRYPDKNFVDCMIVIYKLDAKLAPNVIDVEKKHSIFWGLYTWTTRSKRLQERSMGPQSSNAMQAYPAPNVIDAEKKHSFLLGVYTRTTSSQRLQERFIGSQSSKAMQTYVRPKLLEVFLEEGFIDQIGNVKSFDECPDDVLPEYARALCVKNS